MVRSGENAAVHYLMLAIRLRSVMESSPRELRAWYSCKPMSRLTRGEKTPKPRRRQIYLPENPVTYVEEPNPIASRIHWADIAVGRVLLKVLM